PLTRHATRGVSCAAEGYNANLLWALRDERATRAVNVATLMATIGLYVIVPSGSLPIQDTGLIKSVTEAGPEVSYAEMQRLQRTVIDTIRRDPDVTGVISVVGGTPMNPTPNAGPLALPLNSP